LQGSISFRVSLKQAAPVEKQTSNKRATWRNVNKCIEQILKDLWVKYHVFRQIAIDVKINFIEEEKLISKRSCWKKNEPIQK